jgi:hypothetical protein
LICGRLRRSSIVSRVSMVTRSARHRLGRSARTCGSGPGLRRVPRLRFANPLNPAVPIRAGYKRTPQPLGCEALIGTAGFEPATP